MILMCMMADAAFGSSAGMLIVCTGGSRTDIFAELLLFACGQLFVLLVQIIIFVQSHAMDIGHVSYTEHQVINNPFFGRMIRR